MLPIPLHLPAAEPTAHARQTALNRRMRVCGAATLISLAGTLTLAATAYVMIDAIAAVALLLASTGLVFAVLRQADRELIAPLQIACQEDFSRRIAPLLDELCSTHGSSRAVPAKVRARTHGH